MKITTLALKLSEADTASSGMLYAWAWRILNEYPENLRAAVLKWAEGEPVPELEVNGMTLERALKISKASVPCAIEMLYVAGKDEREGLEMIHLTGMRRN